MFPLRFTDSRRPVVKVVRAGYDTRRTNYHSVPLQPSIILKSVLFLSHLLYLHRLGSMQTFFIYKRNRCSGSTLNVRVHSVPVRCMKQSAEAFFIRRALGSICENSQAGNVHFLHTDVNVTAVFNIIVTAKRLSQSSIITTGKLHSFSLAPVYGC